MANINKVSRIIVFRGGALGDFLLTLPAIAALRRHFPGTYIELAGYGKSASIAMTSGIIDRVQSLDSERMALYFQTSEKLSRDEQEYIRSFDMVISFLHDPDGILLKNLEDAGAKNIITVSPIVGKKTKGYASDRFFRGLKDVIGKEKCTPVKLEWPEELRQDALRRLATDAGNKRVIIVHPGSGSPAKNWPVEKFAMLAKKIRKTAKYQPVIIGGEADVKAIVIMRGLFPEAHFLVNAPLMDVASILSVACGYVGNDSGITHLAAAMGIPVLALFGPTDPAIWAPRGKNVAIIKSRVPSSESLAGIGVETVFRILIGNIG